jgi:hypothetical protein
MGDPMDQDSGLAAAGAGEEQERAFGAEHGLALFGIEMA